MSIQQQQSITANIGGRGNTQRISSLGPGTRLSTTTTDKNSIAKPSTLKRKSASSTRHSSQHHQLHQQSPYPSQSIPALLSQERRKHAELFEQKESELVARQYAPVLRREKKEKETIVESLAAEQNGYLLMLLEKEQHTESERMRLLSTISDPGDQRRLEKIFAVERAKASKTIRQVTKQHEMELAMKMKELGMIDDEEDEYDLE